MRFLFLLVSFLVFTLPAIAGAPVIIENMTTQGCIDTPPAESLLRMIHNEDPDVIILNCHTTYYDEEEWRDPFSLNFCDQRHLFYNDLMNFQQLQTPEFIMNGITDVNSKEISVVRGEISRHRAEHPVYDLNLKRTGRTIEMTMPAMTPKEPLDIYLFSYTPEATSVVTNYIYRNKTLEHFNIVRNIQRIGSWNGDDALLYYDLEEGEKFHHAVIVQDEKSGEIIAAGKI